MAQVLDELMESASQALADLDYPRCESACLDALRQAREADNWAYYRRIVLPLQEARRQKRQAALDGPIRLGTSGRPNDLSELLPPAEAGCVVLTQPVTGEDAAQLDKLAAESGKAVEILFADQPSGATTWTIRSFVGPAVHADRPAPPPGWQDQWMAAESATPPTPAHWFMQASEALGNAGLASINNALGTVERVTEIELLLLAAGDHELLHQTLATAARAVQKAGG